MGSTPNIRGYDFLGILSRQGGMGEIYRARHRFIKGREVAVKVIRPEVANDPKFIRMFETEAQVIAGLEHPHIVPIYDFWREAEQGAFLVMRLMSGGSLADKLQQSTLDLPTTAQILDQVAAALTIAHRKVVHRDIKPPNILLDDEGNAYLSDFGLAYLTDNQLAEEIEATNIGSGAGTPSYMAPEQWNRSHPISPQTDIYSLGILVFEMLTGQLPFKAKTRSELKQLHISNALPPLTPIRPDLPADVQAVLDKATDKDPANRYDTAIDMAKAFREAFTQAPNSAVAIAISVPETYYTELLENPYKGLQSFESQDAALFFGRETFIEYLISTLHPDNGHGAVPFLAVVGPSGSGKSSLVKAGVIPALRGGALAGSDNWFYTSITPKSRPFDSIEAALSSVAVNTPDDLSEILQSSDAQGLAHAVESILPESDSHLVLVIDQFEELFTHDIPDNVRSLFLDTLANVANAPHRQITIIITLRADYYDRPLYHPAFGELLRNNIETVLPLQPDELVRAITEPARLQGVTFEPGLTDRIIDDIGTQPGILPLLQYALTELFENRDGTTLTLGAYQTIGGATGALGRRADDLYSELNSAQQEAIRQLFLRLVTVGDGTEAPTRRRVLRSELASVADDENTINDVIELFSTSRLLTLDRDADTREPTIEVAHEALLLTWQRLNEWVNNSRDAIRTRNRLTTDTRHWLGSEMQAGFLANIGSLTIYEELRDSGLVVLNPEELGFIRNSREAIEAAANQAIEQERRERELAEQKAEQERRAANRARLLVGALAIFLVAAAGLSLFAFNQRSTAVLESTRAADALVDAVDAQSTAEQAVLIEAEALATSEANERVAANEATRAADALDDAVAGRQTAEAAEREAEDAQLEAEFNANVAQTAVENVNLGITAVATAATQEAVLRITAEAAQGIASTNEAAAIAAQQTADTDRQAAVDAQATAVFNADLAQQNRDEAVRNEALAEQQATAAANSAATAIEDRVRAELQATDSANSAATAISAQNEAEARGTEVSLNAAQLQSRGFASNAELSLASGSFFDAMRWALAANYIANASPQAQLVLSRAVYQGPAFWRFEDVTQPPIRDMAYGDNLIAAASQFDIVLYDGSSGRRLDILGDLSSGRVTHLAFSPDNTFLLGANDAGEVALWRIQRSRGNIVGEPWNVLNFGDDNAPMPTLSGDIAEGIQATGGIAEIAFRPATDEENSQLQVVISMQGERGKLLIYNIGDILNTNSFDFEPLEIFEPPLGQHENFISSLVYSPDGKYLLTASNLAVSPKVVLYDANEYTVIGNYFVNTLLEPVHSIAFLQFDATTYRAILGHPDGGLSLWKIRPEESNLEAMELSDTYVHEDGGTIVDVSYSINPREALVLSSGTGRTATLWEYVSDDGEESLQFRRVYRAHSGALTAGRIDPESQSIFTAGMDGVVYAWERENTAILDRYELSSEDVQPAWDLTIVDNSALTTIGNSVIKHRTDRSSEQGRLIMDFPILSVDYRAGDRASYVATGDRTGNVAFWEYGTLAQIATSGADSHADSVSAIALSPDGLTTASGSNDQTIKLWNTETGGLRGTLSGHNANIVALTFSPDGRWIASGDTDGNLYLWEWQVDDDFEELRDDTVGGAIYGIDFTSDSQSLIASHGTDVVYWNIENRGELRQFESSQHTERINAVDISDNDAFVVSAGGDGRIIVWDIAAGEAIRVMHEHYAPVYAVEFYQNDTRILSGDRDGTLIRWQFETQTQIIEYARDLYGALELNCDVRRDYGLLPEDSVCDENDIPYANETQLAAGTPLATPSPFMSPTRTFTPTATSTLNVSEISPTPTLTLTLQTDPSEDEVRSDVINPLLGGEFLGVDRGYLAQRLDLSVINMSGNNNLIRWDTLPLEQEYTDFVIRAEVQWGEGNAAIARCGFLINFQNRENYYLIEVDQNNRIYFQQQVDDVWGVEQQSEPNFAIDEETRVAELVLLAQQNNFRLFVNGNEQGYIEDSSEVFSDSKLQGGQVGLSANVFNQSREASCVFRDVWLWDISRPGTPTPTPTLPPPAPVTLSENIEDVVQSLVDIDVLETTTGYVAERRSRVVIDLSQATENTITWNNIQYPRPYTSFVLHANIEWGQTVPNESCGFALRYFDNANFYIIELDRLNTLVFEEEENDNRTPRRFGDGARIGNAVGDVNNLIVVAKPDPLNENVTLFTAFINGEFAGTFADGSIAEGQIFFATATTRIRQRGSACTFSDVWIYDTSADAPPTPTPTTTPAAIKTIRPGEVETSSIDVGGREIWTLTASEGEQLTIFASADRPMNTESLEVARISNLLDIEFIVRNPQGVIIAQSSDIRFGQQTDAVLRDLILPEDGSYEIEVFSWFNSTGGSYTLQVEQNAFVPTATVEALVQATPSPTLTPSPTSEVGTSGEVPTATVPAVVSGSDANELLAFITDVEVALEERAFDCALYNTFLGVLVSAEGESPDLSPFLTDDNPLMILGGECTNGAMIRIRTNIADVQQELENLRSILES